MKGEPPTCSATRRPLEKSAEQGPVARWDAACRPAAAVNGEREHHCIPAYLSFGLGNVHSGVALPSLCARWHQAPGRSGRLAGQQFLEPGASDAVLHRQKNCGWCLPANRTRLTPARFVLRAADRYLGCSPGISAQSRARLGRSGKNPGSLRPTQKFVVCYGANTLSDISK